MADTPPPPPRLNRPTALGWAMFAFMAAVCLFGLLSFVLGAADFRDGFGDGLPAMGGGALMAALSGPVVWLVATRRKKTPTWTRRRIAAASLVAVIVLGWLFDEQIYWFLGLIRYDSGWADTGGIGSVLGPPAVILDALICVIVLLVPIGVSLANKPITSLKTIRFLFETGPGAVVLLSVCLVGIYGIVAVNGRLEARRGGAQAAFSRLIDGLDSTESYARANGPACLQGGVIVIDKVAEGFPTKILKNAASSSPTQVSYMTFGLPERFIPKAPVEVSTVIRLDWWRESAGYYVATQTGATGGVIGSHEFEGFTVHCSISVFDMRRRLAWRSATTMAGPPPAVGVNPGGGGGPPYQKIEQFLDAMPRAGANGRCITAKSDAFFEWMFAR